MKRETREAVKRIRKAQDDLYNCKHCGIMSGVTLEMSVYVCDARLKNSPVITVRATNEEQVAEAKIYYGYGEQEIEKALQPIKQIITWL